MQRIWSPWRSRPIEDYEQDHSPPPGEASVFERLAAEHEDRKNLILWRGTSVYVVMNLYPYNNGHLMIAPYRPVSEYDALSEDEQMETASAIGLCIRWLKAALKPEGFNVGMNQGAAAGAGIPNHLHIHVVPRWKGDTNFMPVVADTKVVPEAMQETYRKLKAVIEAGGEGQGERAESMDEGALFESGTQNREPSTKN